MTSAAPSAHEPREVPVSPAGEETPGDWRHDLKWTMALLLLAILGLSGWNNAGWQSAPEGREDIGKMVLSLLGKTELVFLLQLLAVLLVAALVAAVVLAMREPEQGGVR